MIRRTTTEQEANGDYNVNRINQTGQCVRRRSVGQGSPSQELIIACVVLVEQLNIQQLSALQDDGLNMSNRTNVVDRKWSPADSGTSDLISTVVVDDASNCESCNNDN